MLKRFLSLVLATGLGVSLITPKAFAKELLSIKSYNATRSAITVDFDGVTDMLDMASLDDKIVIKKYSKGGVTEEIKNNFSIITTKAQYEADNITAEGNTVIIKPNGGLDTESLYNVTFSPGVKDTKGTALMYSASTGWFKVNELFADNFNVEYEQDGETPKEPIYKENNATKSRYFDANYDGTNTGIIGDKLQIRNQTRYAVLNRTGFPNDKQVSDYTVEYQFGLGQNNYYKIAQYISLRNSELRTRNDPINYVGKSGYLLGLDSDYNDDEKKGSLFLKVGNINNDPLIKVSDYQFKEKTVAVRAVVDGSHLQYYIDDNKIFDVINSAYSAQSTIGFAGGSAWNERATTIDDLSITSVTKYGANLPEFHINYTEPYASGIRVYLSKSVTRENVNGFITLKSLDGEDIGFTFDVNDREINIVTDTPLSEGDIVVLTIKENMSAENMSILADDYQELYEYSGGGLNYALIERPQISNLSVTVENGKLTANYDYSGAYDNKSEYYIYSCPKRIGEYKLVKSGILSDSPFIVNAGEEYVNSYIKMCIVTKDSMGLLGGKQETGIILGMLTPEVKISGESTIGKELEVTYDYFDNYLDVNQYGQALTESDVKFRWLIDDAENGLYNTPIEGETGETIVIKSEYCGKFIKAEVTPKKAGVWGTPVLSGAFVLPTKPEARNVKVSGTAKPGYLVSGAYEYYQRNGVEEDNSEYKWYIDGTCVSNERNYTISSADVGKKICFEVTPISKKEPSIGIAVKSSEVTVESAEVTDESNSDSSSSRGGGVSVGFGSISNIVKAGKDKIADNNGGFITNFKDIDSSLYKKEIVELYDRGIIKGVSETEFCPEREITRAEFVTLIVRMLGLGISDYNGTFGDVAENDWYANYVQTAYENSFIVGFDGRFNPNDGIKIEEIVKILVDVYEKNLSQIEADDDEFKNVSEWAVTYAKKAKNVGIIEDDKKFKLNGKAARDEAAALISKFLEKTGDVK